MNGRLIDMIKEKFFSNENRLINGAITAEEYEDKKELNIDFNFIGELEGNVLEANVPDPEGSKSGVTVGTGIDLGARTREDFAGFDDQELLDRFDEYFGLQGMEAFKYEQDNPLVISQEESDALNAFIKGQSTQRLDSNFSNVFGVDLADLPPELQTVVASIGYQYGPNFMVDNPDTEEFDPKTPKFVNLLSMIAKDPKNPEGYKNISNELMNFGDRYKTRREKEAELIQGLYLNMLPSAKDLMTDTSTGSNRTMEYRGE